MLTTIKIKNFKGIKDTTIYCQEDYNVLIGANNVGKTTVFEAIHLWKMCYDTNIKKKLWWQSVIQYPFQCRISGTGVLVGWYWSVL